MILRVYPKSRLNTPAIKRSSSRKTAEIRGIHGVILR